MSSHKQADDEPLGFFCYSTEDEKWDNGAITALCLDLSNAIKIQTGKEFEIFFDRKDIKWGDQWSKRIDAAVTSASFFFPILSPCFFESKYCRYEVQEFLKYEARTDRVDFMLPIVYIAPEWLGKEKITRPKLAERILSHQHVDWTKFRLSNRKSPNRKRQLEAMAIPIRDAITRTQSLRETRGPQEPIWAPRSFVKGQEQEPEQYGRVLAIVADDENTGPQQRLLQMAIYRKQQGDYQEAKALHDRLIENPINWETSPGRFVDLVYFSVSLHDKLEEWPRLDDLETFFFKSHFSKLRNIVTAAAFSPMITMYEASMALAMLRQTRIMTALERIERALKDPPIENEAPAKHILYANALATRCLIQHAAWSYDGGSDEILQAARADIDAAESVYRKYAKLGESDEYHHVGRFYGTSAFLQIAERKSQKKSLLDIANQLLGTAERAHQGKNRTSYGKIAGMYCHAYCLFEVALEQESDSRLKLLYKAHELLRDALGRFDDCVALGRYKVTGLWGLVIKSIGKGDFVDDIEIINAQREKALQRLRAVGFQRLDQITRREWLNAPLN